MANVSGRAIPVNLSMPSSRQYSTCQCQYGQTRCHASADFAESGCTFYWGLIFILHACMLQYICHGQLITMRARGLSPSRSLEEDVTLAALPHNGYNELSCSQTP